MSPWDRPWRRTLRLATLLLTARRGGVEPDLAPIEIERGKG